MKSKGSSEPHIGDVQYNESSRVESAQVYLVRSSLVWSGQTGQTEMQNAECAEIKTKAERESIWNEETRKNVDCVMRIEYTGTGSTV